jgi:hypothetical protein
MIPLPTGVRVWSAAGHIDMRRGMQSLALQVQEALKRDPHAAISQRLAASYRIAFVNVQAWRDSRRGERKQAVARASGRSDRASDLSGPPPRPRA